MIDERNLEKTKEILNSSKSILNAKKIDKIFSEVNTNASLKEALSSFTRADLDDVRRNLEVVGASSLKKSELIEVIAERIKSSLCSILEKLSEKEHILLHKIVVNNGLLKFNIADSDTVLSLRKYGIIITVEVKDYGRYLLIPQELRPELKSLNVDTSAEIACSIDGESDVKEETFKASLPINSDVFKKGKIGRNDACPCGSGKKFKRCCLAPRTPSLIQ